LLPPPRCRVVIFPWLLRPACFCSRSVNGLYGRSVVTSSNDATVMPRRPGEVGL
jgi:hypothetical protein